MKRSVRARRIHDVLELNAQGASVRSISSQLGIPRSTVHDYLARAESLGMGHSLAESEDFQAVERRLFPKSAAAESRRGGEPDWTAAWLELKQQPGTTLRELWTKFGSSHRAEMSYGEFCRSYRRWLGEQDPVLQLSHGPGEMLYVTFLAGGMSIQRTGDVGPSRVDVFVAMMGASGLLYVAPSRAQRLENWLDMHRSAFDFFGLAARALVPDFSDPHLGRTIWRNGAIAPEYLALAQSYGSTVMPTLAFREAARIATAASVDLVRQWELEWNQEAEPTLDGLLELFSRRAQTVNSAPIPAVRKSRADLFDQLERPDRTLGGRLAR